RAPHDNSEDDISEIVRHSEAPKPEPEPTRRRVSPPRSTPAQDIEPVMQDWQPPVAQTAGQPVRSGSQDDLAVPWGWLELGLFVVLAFVGSLVIYQGFAEILIRVFGVARNDIFGDAMSTSKSIMLLVAQAMIDCGWILCLYLILLAEGVTPFWRSIG